MDMQMVNLTIGLLVFMMANVTLGSLNSLFDGTFDKKKFFIGVGKALIVLLVYCGVYYAGTLNADIVVMEIDGVKANIMTAIYIVGLAGYVAYGKQLIEKLKVLMVPKNIKK